MLGESRSPGAVIPDTGVSNGYQPRLSGRLYSAASGLFIALVIQIPAVSAMVWAGPHKVTAGTFELLSRKVKKLHDPLGSNLHAAWERLSVLLQQIKIPPQFANSNTINPPLLDIQQCLPHHFQCQ